MCIRDRISEELKNIKEKFAIPRRTKIIDAVLNYDIEETIQKQSVIITVTLQGYIKRGSLDGVKKQKRGGKGKSGITTRDQDSVVQTLSVNTHTSVLFFSTEGLVYKIKAWKIPEGSSSSKGKSLFNILPLKSHQAISSIMPMPEEETDLKNYQIIFATAQGKVRKNSLEDFSSINASGKIAMKLDNNDKIVGVKICKDDQDIILSTKFGKCIRFEAKKLRVFKGRSSKGIKAWKIPEGSASSKGKSLFNILPLKNHQSISSIMPFPEDESDLKNYQIVFATAQGKIRKNSLDDFSSINASGKIAMKLDNNDKIVGVKICKDDQDIILSTKFGKCIRFEAKKLRVFKGRSSKGIKGIELSLIHISEPTRPS